MSGFNLPPGVGPDEPESLRDYFAGQALAGFCANPDFDPIRKYNESPRAAMARIAYMAADAMLAERAKGGAK